MAKTNNRCCGWIVRFNEEKGYGFIRPEKEGDDLFVHRSEIRSDSFDTLRIGQAVKFTVVFDSQLNKSKAVDVIGIDTRGGGVVFRFSNERGFGFIKPYKGGDELFVHHSEINSNDDYPTLQKGQAIEFTVIFDGKSNKKKAIDVTGVNGSPIVNSQPKNLRGGVGECFKCGQLGHMAKDCSGVSRSIGSKDRSTFGGGEKCYTCGKRGHMARDCLKLLSGGGGGRGHSESNCFGCGKKEHLARDCPNGTLEKSNN